MLSAEEEAVNSADWCTNGAPVANRRAGAVNRWVSKSGRRRASIRAGEIDIVSFQALLKPRAIRFEDQWFGVSFALLQSEKEEAMKTKTRVKSGRLAANHNTIVR